MSERLNPKSGQIFQLGADRVTIASELSTVDVHPPLVTSSSKRWHCLVPGGSATLIRIGDAKDGRESWFIERQISGSAIRTGDGEPFPFSGPLLGNKPPGSLQYDGRVWQLAYPLDRNEKTSDWTYQSGSDELKFEFDYEESRIFCLSALDVTALVQVGTDARLSQVPLDPWGFRRNVVIKILLVFGIITALAILGFQWWLK